VLDSALDREQRENLEMAKTSALSLLGLINDILDFSKIEAGRLEFEQISFSLRACLGAMLKPLGLRADQKGLELTADIAADAPDHVVGDPLRLRQILINLIDNAIKFTKCGDVMLRVTFETADGVAPPHLHFAVADTGIGIPADKQAVIFEAFAQADGSTTRTYGGTGLGLTISSQLVQQMGGRIWVESVVGEGTTFHFTACLPVRESHAPDAHPADPGALADMRVLVVDDNEVNRRILHQTLSNWRMQPLEVASGQQALAELQRAVRSGAPFPLVLLDGMMPGMDGFAVAQRIRDDADLSHATVLMLTSGTSAGAAARCKELGVASYLVKPAPQSELLEAILVAIGRAPSPADGGIAPPVAEPGAKLRILLVEDNVINRAVAARFLQRRGHSAVQVATGAEAIEAVVRRQFDLIFMDVQMPGMDGFETTRRIRELEAVPGGGHVAIAAMTAHAMVGDRERCLASGMDDYISKPLEKAELLALLDRVHAPAAAAPPAIHVPEEVLPAAAPTFDRVRLLDRLDGDEELLAQMIALSRGDTPGLLENIRSAVARRDAGDLSRSAHALLSSLGAFGAMPAHGLAQRLEVMGQQEDLAEAGSIFEALEREADRMTAALEEMNGELAGKLALTS
jgi:two-component system sensor histidine kinase/response regulator